MQLLNNKNLQTIYEKGDQNLQQMQQIEDLSSIIRKRDNIIEELNSDIADLTDQNRGLHKEIQNIKEEQAKENANRGMEMMAKLNARKDGGMSATKKDPITPKKVDPLQNVTNMLSRPRK